MKRIATTVAALTLVAGSAAIASAGTLDDVKKRGSVICGVGTGLAGFAIPDDKGKWTGFDADLCYALAAAIFDDATKVTFKPLTAKDRFAALQSSEVDILSRNTTWTMSRDTSLGLNFAGINYYDGQGFMVSKKLNVKSALELNGASVCTQQGTTTELNLADYFRANNMKYEAVVFASATETIKAYDAGRCDVFTTDQSGLYAERLRLTNPENHVILPEIISKEPLGPAVRHGDDAWLDVVKWTLNAMINAEELGVTQKNVADMMKSGNPEIKRLLGTEGEFGKSIGLTNDWVVRIVKHVGNYGDSFERNLGMSTQMKIARGKNELWTKGGLQYAPPIR